jgi:ATP-dependent exoDNAse (exonuclease V) beta subunit
MKNFLIYRASAGSGKTYTLVKEYLRLVLSDSENFRSTLAVTFTNKAAAEMKTRIVESLVKLSRGEDKTLEVTLRSEGVKKNIPLEAANVLQKTLHQYSYFSVSTIDSFFHKIIRSFAKELKLQLGYDIELDKKEVMDKIVNDLLDSITSADNDKLRQYLEKYVFYSIDDDKGWKIELRIKAIADEIFKEAYWIRKSLRNTEDLTDSRDAMDAFTDLLYAILSTFDTHMRERSIEAEELLHKFDLSIEDFPYGKSGFMNYLIKKIRFKDYEPGKRVLEACADINKWLTKKSSPNVMIAAKGGLFSILKETISYYEKNSRKYNTAKELVKTVHILGIFGDLLEKLKIYRDENKTMLISDTNNLLRSVISDDNTPFIYEKTGNIYRNFLIDEFQDTSTFQWKNFLPLVQNSLSENNFSMVVGDVKQSIYRWRNGNMKLLLEGVREDLTGFDEMIDERLLDENRRSRKNVIEFNNGFFREAADIIAERVPEGKSGLILDAYKEVEQKSTFSKDGGSVYVDIIKNDEEDVSSREISIRRTIEAVQKAIAAGYRQKDIMILVRNKADGSEASYYLTEAGLRVVSSDSLLLTNSPRVKLLVNLLKYIGNSENYFARTEILYNYLRFFKEESYGKYSLHEIFNDWKKKNNSIFNTELPDGFINQRTNTIHPDFFGLSLYETLENLIRIFELNSGSDTYLLRFLDVIREYSIKNNSDITAFIDWWEENQSDYSIIVPESEDALRVMTIHKAKGLQSPVVILPYCNWNMDISGNRDMIWASSDVVPFDCSSAFYVKAEKALEKSYFSEDYSEEAALTNLDNLNLLYVAFTRAIDHLIVNIPESGSTKYVTGKLISEVLQEDSPLHGFISNEMAFGDVEIKEEGKSEIPYKIDNLISSEFKGKLSIKSTVGESIDESERIEEIKNRGSIIHKALSYINNKSEIDSAIERLVLDGEISADDVKSLKVLLNNFFKNETVKKWYGGEYELIAEEGILLTPELVKKNNGIRSVRPDRIFKKDNSLIIVDFKTGSDKSHEKYQKQINFYADILTEMKYEISGKYIYYINSNKVVEVI